MLNRRRFLLTVAAISTTVAAGVFIGRPHLAKLVRPKLDTSFPLGSLQDDEMHTIVALCKTLLWEVSVMPAKYFQDYVNAITNSEPGFLKEYQSAAKLLDATSKRLFARGAPLRFRDLSRTERDKVVQKLLWRYDASDRIVRKIEKIEATRDALALRIYVMKPLIKYYYRSAYGWAVVGYKSFPGRPPLDPRAYTRPLIDDSVM